MNKVRNLRLGIPRARLFTENRSEKPNLYLTNATTKQHIAKKNVYKCTHISLIMSA